MSDKNFEILCPKLELDLVIPNHSNELSKAESIILDISTKIKKTVKPFINKDGELETSITDKTFETLYEEVVKMLDYVGTLSVSVFEVEAFIESSYIAKYIHNPLEAKFAWYKHYSELHNPYSLLKNRCFNLLSDLDDEYFKKFKKLPPNYNY